MKAMQEENHERVYEFNLDEFNLDETVNLYDAARKLQKCIGVGQDEILDEVYAHYASKTRTHITMKELVDIAIKIRKEKDAELEKFEKGYTPEEIAEGEEHFARTFGKFLKDSDDKLPF